MNYFFRTTAICVAFFCMGLDWFSSGPKSEVEPYWDVSDNTSITQVDHQLWQQLLDDYLVEDDSGINLVDYEGVQEDAEVLQRYIDSLAAIDPRTLNPSEQMSFWINLYNALTVQVVAKSYPVDSIKDLGDSLFSSGPWDDDVVTITGRLLTLNDIEHRILRPVFKDYRIHFAVNCASIGCPNLASSAYTADNLEELLNQGARSYLSHERGVGLVDGALRLSSLFKWYRDDFGNTESEMLKTLGKYLDEDLREDFIRYNGEIEYHYDWFLNDLG